MIAASEAATGLAVFTVSPFFAVPLGALLALGNLAPLASAFEAPSVEAVISVADQKMAILREGGLVARYPVSTSKFGTGDANRSYKTPLGRLKVCDKIGDRAALGTVIKHRQMTGEVLPANAPGRDPIVTRVLWLEGCESQNANARERSIYIHGTVEENRIGKPVSWGCIRMRSQDVVTLFDELPVGATVTILADRLPKYPKYEPKPVAPPPILIVNKKVIPPPIASVEAAPKHAEKPAPLVAARTPEKPVAVAPAHPAEKPAVAVQAPIKPTVVALASRGQEKPPARAPEKIVASRSVEKPAAPLTPVHIATQFASTNPRAARTDLLQAMRSSILLTGTEDTSLNSEVPRIER